MGLLHAGEENLFSGLTALSAEFTIGEGRVDEPHDVPLGCSDEYDDLHIRSLFRTFIINSASYPQSNTQFY